MSQIGGAIAIEFRSVCEQLGPRSSGFRPMRAHDFLPDSRLFFSLGVLVAAGSGAGSFSVLIGSASRHLPAEKRGMAAGIINAGGSFGQFVFAPITQKLISALGWMGAMWSIAAIALAALPITRSLRGKPASANSTVPMPPRMQTALANHRGAPQPRKITAAVIVTAARPNT